MFFLRKITFKMTAYSNLHRCQTESRNEQRVGESERENERKRERAVKVVPLNWSHRQIICRMGAWVRKSHLWTLVAFLCNSQLNCAILLTSWKFFHTVEFETVIFYYTCKFHYDTRGRHKFECHQYSLIWANHNVLFKKIYKVIKTKVLIPILESTPI